MPVAFGKIVEMVVSRSERNPCTVTSVGGVVSTLRVKVSTPPLVLLTSLRETRILVA
jgi:hypothetical protein